MNFKKTVTRIGFLAATVALATAGVAGTSAAQENIVGGSVVTVAPSWAAAVGDSSGMWCSGTLVSSQWVLTAGHCSGATRVRIGSKDLNSGGQVRTVSRSVKHPNYNNSAYDFRLYKLSSTVTLAPATLGTTSPAVGSSAGLYGFGQTCAPYGCGDMSPVLKTVGTTLTTDSACGGITGSVELCFDTSTTATDCYGDSGGPAFVAGRLVGVVSRGATGSGSSTCGRTNSIFGDVTAVRSWITTTIAS